MEEFKEAKKQIEKEIIEAYVFLRQKNNTIPSETLEFMKDAAIDKLWGGSDKAETSESGLNLCDVSQQRELFYNFITWYNSKPKIKKPKDGLITTTIIEEYLKL